MKKICPNCLTISEPKMRGSFLISIILLIVFFPAAIIYEIWRYQGAKNICLSCGAAGMIPLDSPKGKMLNPVTKEEREIEIDWDQTH